MPPRFVFYEPSQEAKDKLIDLRAEMAANRFLLAGYRLQALPRKANFKPSRPRVPAGHPDGGQWTGSGGGIGGGKPVGDGDLQPVVFPPDDVPNDDNSPGERIGSGFQRVADRTSDDSAAAAARRNLFRQSMDQLTSSKLLASGDVARFTFDPRYAAFRYERRAGADVAVSDSGGFFETQDELGDFVAKNSAGGYTAVRGYTDRYDSLFTRGHSVIYGSAAHAGNVEGIIQEFCRRQS